MSYRSSIEIAAACSVVIHLAVISGIGYGLQHREAKPAPNQTTMVIALKPPDPTEEKEVKYLVDTVAPAQRPVEKTDLISNQDSQARDNSPEENSDLQPTSETTSEFNELGGAEPVPSVPPVPLQPASPTSSQPVRQEAPPEAETAPPLEDAFEQNTVARAPVEVPPATVEQPATEAPEPEPEPVPEPEQESELVPEPFQVAQSPIPAQPILAEIDSTRTRESGGAKDEGSLSFEANRHELGEYMRRVRRMIRLEWRRGLQIRYRGSGPAEAVIKFGITPSGRLEFAKVVDQGTSITFAAMCKGAIESAGPYPPFPFDVPVEYRTQNLEIQIHFNYR
jgi:outer membrane biosynthesis protein TonB